MDIVECSFMIMAVTRLPAATTLEYMRTGQVSIRNVHNIHINAAHYCVTVCMEILRDVAFVDW